MRRKHTFLVSSSFCTNSAQFKMKVILVHVIVNLNLLESQLTVWEMSCSNYELESQRRCLTPVLLFFRGVLLQVLTGCLKIGTEHIWFR